MPSTVASNPEGLDKYGATFFHRASQRMLKASCADSESPSHTTVSILRRCKHVCARAQVIRQPNKSSSSISPSNPKSSIRTHCVHIGLAYVATLFSTGFARQTGVSFPPSTPLATLLSPQKADDILTGPNAEYRRAKLAEQDVLTAWTEHAPYATPTMIAARVLHRIVSKTMVSRCSVTNSRSLDCCSCF